MPKIVNHFARRNEIVDAYLQLAGRRDIASLSSRSLAAELHVSNSLLWRYFEDMDDLLATAYRTVIRNVDDRIMFAVHDLHGFDAIRVMIGELLPLTPTSRAESLVVMRFWGLEVTQGSTIANDLHETEAWTQLLARFIDEAVSADDIKTSQSTADLAAIMMALINDAQIAYAAGGDVAAAKRTAALIERLLHA